MISLSVFFVGAVKNKFSFLLMNVCVISQTSSEMMADVDFRDIIDINIDKDKENRFFINIYFRDDWTLVITILLKRC